MFDITLNNLNGNRAKIRYYDPMTDTAVDAAVVASAPDSITVRLPLTDSPRLLEITERAPGVSFVMVTPVIRASDEFFATRTSIGIVSTNFFPITDSFAFTVNADAEVDITIGAFPTREGRFALTVSSKKDYYHIVHVPPLQENEGIKIVARAKGLEARYPLWDYDPAFAHPPLPQGVTKQDVFVPVRLPDLPPQPRPEKLEGGGRVVETLENVFPVLAVADAVETEVVTFETFPAWRVTIRLDPPSHLGETNLNRSYLIVPLEQGFNVRDGW
jgi:hypothetical protein